MQIKLLKQQGKVIHMRKLIKKSIWGLSFLASMIMMGINLKSASAATVLSEEIMGNVKQFVISEDGEDDFGIIQKCISSNGDAGVFIILQPGTYYIEEAFKVFNNTTITATGSTIVETVNGKGFVMNCRFEGSKYGNGQGGYNSCKNIIVDGGTWVGTYKPDPTKRKKSDGFYVGYSGFMFMHGKNITVKNASFKNNYNGHFIEFAGIKNGKIVNCNMNIKGSKYVGESNNEAIQIDNTYAKENSPIGAPWDDTPCVNITVQGCNIKYVRGIGTNRIGTSSYVNINILENTILSTKGEGINAYDIIGLKVCNNTVKVLHKKDDYTSVGLYLGLDSKINTWGTYSTLISDNKITGYSAGIKIVGFNGATFEKVSIKNNNLLSRKSKENALVIPYKGKQIKNLINSRNILKKAA